MTWLLGLPHRLLRGIVLLLEETTGVGTPVETNEVEELRRVLRSTEAEPKG